MSKTNEIVLQVEQVTISIIEDMHKKFFGPHDAAKVQAYIANLQEISSDLMKSNMTFYSELQWVIQNLFDENHYINSFALGKLHQMLQMKVLDLASPCIWTYAHHLISEKCKPSFMQGHFDFAVKAGVEEIIVRIRNFRDANGLEEILDDTEMLSITFDKEGNNLKFNNLSSENEKNIQEGYTKIFAGVMQAMRHMSENPPLSEGDAARKLLMLSDLMYQIDEALALLWKNSNLSN